MGRNNYFRFKQFTIYQEQSAMKVGTDGILLGAWANSGNCNEILDIGTGTGLIALMLAQRSGASITGIEIDEIAALEARQNVADSRWQNQIEIESISLQEFTKTCTKQFDLIVSNPPFFNQSLKNNDTKRTLARHTVSLPYSELVNCVQKLLNAKGKFALILPFISAKEFEKLAVENGLFLARKTEIRPNFLKSPNRVLLEFSKVHSEPWVNSLSIYSEKGSVYSEEFKNLTKDYYLIF